MKNKHSGIRKSLFTGITLVLVTASAQAMADRDRGYWDDGSYNSSAERIWRDRDIERRDDDSRRYRPRDEWRDEYRDHNERRRDADSDRGWRDRGRTPYSRDRDEHRSNNTQITGHVDQIEDLSEHVKNSLRDSKNLKKSGLGKLNGLLSAFDAQANRLRSSWKGRQSASGIRPIVRDLRSQSRSIDQEIQRRGVSRTTRDYWNSLQSELDSLSRSVD